MDSGGVLLAEAEGFDKVGFVAGGKGGEGGRGVVELRGVSWE